MCRPARSDLHLGAAVIVVAVAAAAEAMARPVLHAAVTMPEVALISSGRNARAKE